jgi:TonB family protein
MTLPSPGAAAPPRSTPRRFEAPNPQRSATPNLALPDAPALNPGLSAGTSAPPPGLGVPSAPVPPQIEPQEKPKLTFERPGTPTGQTGLGRIPAPPKNTIEEAARQVARGSRGGIVVGDIDGGPGASPNSPAVPIPGKMGSAVELMSDPMGVDFWPYLLRVLSSVRRNWYAVIPESAKLGRRGRTVIQFAISKDGSVPKLVIAAPSGAEALDRAAVAGISASNPFPPLPPEFRGGQIRLQFVFKYNVK